LPRRYALRNDNGGASSHGGGADCHVQALKTENLHPRGNNRRHDGINALRSGRLGRTVKERDDDH
jgi:hypothetical protein